MLEPVYWIVEQPQFIPVCVAIIVLSAMGVYYGFGGWVD